MKARVIRIMLISFLLTLTVALLADGKTTAFFTGKAPVPPSRMVMGTVAFDLSWHESFVSEEPVAMEWAADECKEFVWKFFNRGSKRILLRARPVVTRRHDETAWAEGMPFVDDGKGNWAMYFTYKAGESKKTVDLLAGQHYKVGTVSVWTKDGYVYVQYITDDDARLTQTHLAVTDDLKLIPVTADKNAVPGQFPFKQPHDFASEYTYAIPLSGTYPDGLLQGKKYSWNKKTLYIAAHADVDLGEVPVEDITWRLSDDCRYLWVEGEPEEINGQIVTWWYYCQPVLPDDEIMLCLTGCLDERANKGAYSIYLEAEAVQASNNAASYLWQLPCENAD